MASPYSRISFSTELLTSTPNCSQYCDWFSNASASEYHATYIATKELKCHISNLLVSFGKVFRGDESEPGLVLWGVHSFHPTV